VAFSMDLKDRKARAKQVIAGLKLVFPNATCALNFETPLDLTVATILSAQCTDERVNMVTKDLFKKYQSAQDYAAAPPGVLEEEIHPTGFFRQKSISLRRMGQKLVEKFDGEVPRTMAEMIQIPGVARKTANVVLGTAYGIPSGIVVDTHVHRLSFRLGLSDEKDPVKIERDLMEVVPREEWIWFGHAMILHGRETCIARTPRCSACVLQGFCPKRGVPAAIADLAGRKSRQPGTKDPSGRYKSTL
jgi:endonuclease-3